MLFARLSLFTDPRVIQRQQALQHPFFGGFLARCSLFVGFALLVAHARVEVGGVQVLPAIGIEDGAVEFQVGYVKPLGAGCRGWSACIS
jgi:hypothetical protein